MKILLVNPKTPQDSGRDLYTAPIAGPMFAFQPFTKMRFGLPLALPTLAAHTPSKHQVEIIDEEVEQIDFNRKYDLVGITTMTYKAPRAYKLAKAFMKTGAKVVMGGIHASMCPDEASKYFDSVAIGEAEKIWPKMLGDCQNNNLQKFYKEDEFPDLKTCLPPRYELVKNRHYVYTCLQTTRGCPNNCNFCIVTKHNGRKLRKKSINQVIEEIDSIIKLKKTYGLIYNKRDKQTRKFKGIFGFADDNFAIDRQHAVAVCQAIKKYQDDNNIYFTWFTQVNSSIGFDHELLDLMAESNCLYLLIGFESLEPESLKTMKKKMNSPQDYSMIIKNIHDKGIRVIYSTIFDDNSIKHEAIDSLTAFINKTKVLYILTNILTPYPGTDLRKEMESKGLISSNDHALFNIRNLVYKPKGISKKEFYTNYLKINDELFSFDKIISRSNELCKNQHNLTFPILARIPLFLGLIGTSLLLCLRGKLKPIILLKLIQLLPSRLLGSGNLSEVELLVIAADHDDYKDKEERRIKGLINSLSL
jgi:radical SAM superfamily enzyme YgiQ (UPF0313 family)